MGISALLASQILDASATGRSVLTGADASAIRSTLGLGTLSTQSPTGTPSASTFLRGDYSWQTIDLSGYLTLTGGTMTGRLQTPSILLAGNFSVTAWTTSGVGLSHTARTLTDTSSTGTVATAYTNVLGGNTIAASNATTFTDYASLFIGSPSAGTNVTITNPFSLITQGAVRFGGAVGINAGTLNGTVLDISQTWGGTGTYTGLKYNVTDSGPANAASLLMDLQVGGTSRLALDKNGWLRLRDSFYSLGVVANLSNVPYLVMSTGQLYLNSTISLSNNNPVVAPDVVITRDAAQTLAQRNGTNPQVHRIYNTFTDSSNYERAKIAWESNVLRIGTEKAGTGSARALELQTDGVTRLTIGTTGAATFSSTATFTGAGPVINIVRTGFSHFTLGDANGDTFRVQNGGDSSDMLRIHGTTKLVTIYGNIDVGTRNVVTDTTTGTKIGTATTQKLGFWNATPVVQPTAVADATDAASVITQLNALLSRMRDLGLIAT